jgi:hypothetical protein
MPSRTVHHGDGVAWVEAFGFGPEHAVVTSLPDVSELRLDVGAWREWFIATAATITARIHDDAVAIFYQTDIKHDGRWIDKGHLVHTGADRSGSACLWHKIVCRAPAGTTTFGRPAHAHLLAFSRALRIEPGKSSPDVLPQMGAMTWARAMGTAACEAAVQFVARHTACRTIVDPFCGHGTMLAVANAHGLDAIGVELSAKRARKAEALVLAPTVA